MTNIELFKLLKDTFYINGKIHKRYTHTIGVIEMALTLNKMHHLNLDEDKIILAAGLHDIAKLVSKEEMLDVLNKYYPEDVKELMEFPSVWHGWVGCIFAKEKYNISDIEVLNAIKYHTTGKVEMNNLEKLIFVSDYIEKNTRIYDDMIITRKLAYHNLDDAVRKTLLDTIEYLQKENKPIYSKTLQTYQYYLDKGKVNV